MINFFRKIRRKFADNNQFLKYSRYAFGEIFLVVIGILIALQINTWNGNRKNSKTEMKYIEGLILNVENDIEALGDIINNNVERMQSITYISNYFKQQDELTNNSLLQQHLINIWFVEFYSNQSFIFDGIKSSGKLNLIASDDIRFEILNYYKANEMIIEGIQRTNANINILLMDSKYRNKIDFTSMIEPNHPESIRSESSEFDSSFFIQNINSPQVKEFRNSLSLMMGMIQINNAFFIQLRAQADLFNKVLNTYLVSNDKFEKKNVALGQPNILVNGKASDHEIVLQDGLSDENWMEIDSNEIKITYPTGLRYGTIQFTHSKIKSHEVNSIDYSGYESISLELKGEFGGEKVSITFLDTDDLGDGSEVWVPLVLSDQWKTYQISLDKFHKTNFSSLIQSPCLVLQEEALSFRIKNIEFKK